MSAGLPSTAPIPLATPARVHVLHPGDVACVDRGERLETLLGSCVAIVLTDPRRTTGAMCHIVHASPAPADDPDNTAFAAVALARLQRLLQARGIVPSLCQAYVFGGGNMFPALTGSQRHVGDANVQWALDTLATAGIPVLAQDTGGNRYRRVAWTVGPQPPQVTAVPV